MPRIGRLLYFFHQVVRPNKVFVLKSEPWPGVGPSQLYVLFFLDHGRRALKVSIYAAGPGIGGFLKHPSHLGPLSLWKRNTGTKIMSQSDFEYVRPTEKVGTIDKVVAFG